MAQRGLYLQNQSVKNLPTLWPQKFTAIFHMLLHRVVKSHISLFFLSSLLLQRPRHLLIIKKKFRQVHVVTPFSTSFYYFFCYYVYNLCLVFTYLYFFLKYFSSNKYFFLLLLNMLCRNWWSWGWLIKLPLIPHPKIWFDVWDVNTSLLHKAVLFNIPLIFFCQIFFCLCLTVWARAAGPRLRIDQISALTWKEFLIILSGYLLFLSFCMFL